MRPGPRDIHEVIRLGPLVHACCPLPPAAYINFLTMPQNASQGEHDLVLAALANAVRVFQTYNLAMMSQEQLKSEAQKLLDIIVCFSLTPCDTAFEVK